jgi:alpha-N-arabinofuranosidase
MEDFITRNSAVLDKYDPAKKISFAVDEWGTWYDPGAGLEPGFLYQQNTLRDALVAAINLNIFHHHADRVRLAAIAQMVNVLQAMILTKGTQMLLTPTYYTFRMFRSFQDATLLPTYLQTPQYSLGTVSVPAVSISAARTTGGAIVVALVNLDPNQAIALSATIPGANAQHVSGEMLNAPTMDAHNTFEDPYAVRSMPFAGASVSGGVLSLTLPAKSVVVLTLQ